MLFMEFGHGGLSPAELSAARLDGDLVVVGDAHVPAHALETPFLRAATLRPVLGDDLIAIGHSAAWVHGALGLPPRVHHVQRGRSRTKRPIDHRVRFRDTALDDADVVRIGGVRVSSRARTLVELARIGDDDPTGAAAARRIATPEVTREAIAWLDSHLRFPGRRPARRFIDAVIGGDGGAMAPLSVPERPTRT
ncbi:type IV toxin-antitoxin system AbiEi family antitoxin [Microbacterium marinilacus]|uniref:AbiEi antitoxin C-terminal domain-containing protein n=1 Tax=Microbacterium marinilacus TaxID=415209 RepID=A0ABP7B1H5_9MICO|nr:type IV toxin-antitoxin system AbiEi family antitoxin [Microbacterium marinilacus]MBY0688754.1 type IV toxin-antitoxin system AbiEi family antitoxin [Microbacterium marinilacus]